MAELDTIYLTLAAQAVAMLVTTAVYYALRLRIETQKATDARKSFESMVEYHSRRLDLEQEKLELARIPKHDEKREAELIQLLDEAHAALRVEQERAENLANLADDWEARFAKADGQLAELARRNGK